MNVSGQKRYMLMRIRVYTLSANQYISCTTTASGTWAGRGFTVSKV